MRHTRGQGFTLIELLVVIAIVGLVSTIALVGISSARGKARDSKRVTDIQQLQKALELYYSSNQSYPSGAAGTVLGTGSALTLCGNAFFASTCTGTSFMGVLPVAPRPEDGSCTAAQNSYTYTSSATTGTSTSYSLTFCLGTQSGSIVGGPHTASPSGVQ